MRRRGSPTRSLALAGALVLPGCRDDPPPPQPAAPTDRASDAAFRQQANTDALREAAVVLSEALALADPVADHQARATPLRAAWLDSTEAAALRKQLDRAAVATSHIESEVLSSRDAAVLFAMRFAVDRLRDHIVRRPRARTSPMAVVHELERWFAELRHLVAHERCDEACIEAIVRTAERLPIATASIGAASPAELRGTRAAIATMIATVGQLEQRSGAPLAAPLGQLRGALAAWTEQLEAMEASLSTAPVATRDDAIAEATRPTDVRRLPDRVGATAVRRGLEVQERILAEPQALYADLGHALARVTAMLDKRKAIELGPTRRVDRERCDAEAERLRSWAEQQPAVAKAEFDCAAALRRLGPRDYDDGELRTVLTEAMIVEPTERARRAEELDVLALVSGEFAPLAHRRALTLAVLTGLRDEVGTKFALMRAHDELCLAAAALWLHAELGTELVPSFANTCPQRTLVAWQAEALRDPWGALRGLGLVRLGGGPAEIVALERFWWAPLGLVDRLAAPDAPKDVPVRTKVERLEPPEPTEPTEPAEAKGADAD